MNAAGWSDTAHFGSELGGCHRHPSTPHHNPEWTYRRLMITWSRLSPTHIEKFHYSRLPLIITVCNRCANDKSRVTAMSVRLSVYLSLCVLRVTDVHVFMYLPVYICVHAFACKSFIMMTAPTTGCIPNYYTTTTDKILPLVKKIAFYT